MLVSGKVSATSYDTICETILAATAFAEKIPGQWHIGHIAHWPLGLIERREILHKLMNIYTTQREVYYKHW